MDAITDMDQVGEGQSVTPIQTDPKKKQRKGRKLSKIDKMKSTDNTDNLSSSPAPDVYGQMYLWDLSEDPNVVIKQARLEEFLYKVLTHKDGVSTEVFTSIIGYLTDFVSPRFKREVFFYMTKDGDVYKFTPPKFTGPAAAEIWS